MVWEKRGLGIFYLGVYYIMSKIILTVNNQPVYDSTKQNTGDSNNLTNNSVKIGDLEEVSNPQLKNSYFYESTDRDEYNKVIIKDGVLKNIRQDETSINEYTKYYTIDDENYITKLYIKRTRGGGDTQIEPKKSKKENKTKPSKIRSSQSSSLKNYFITNK